MDRIYYTDNDERKRRRQERVKQGDETASSHYETSINLKLIVIENEDKVMMVQTMNNICKTKTILKEFGDSLESALKKLTIYKKYFRGNPFINRAIIEAESFGLIKDADDKHSVLGKNIEHEAETISKANLANNKLAIFHGFLFVMCITIIHPCLMGYMKNKIKVEPQYGGYMTAVTNVAGIVGALAMNIWTNKNYKSAILFCDLCVAFSFVLYIASGFLSSTWVMLISRLFLGFGSGKVISRRYVLHYSPETMVRKFSMEYSAAMGMGGAFGPFSQFLLTYLPDYSIDFMGRKLEFDQYTYPGYFAMLLMFIHFALVFLFFSDPYNKDFYKTEEDKQKSNEVQLVNIKTQTLNESKEKLIQPDTTGKKPQDNFNRYEDIKGDKKEEKALSRHGESRGSNKKKVSSLQNVKVVLAVVITSLCIIRVTTDTIFSCLPFYILTVINAAPKAIPGQVKVPTAGPVSHDKDRLTPLIITLGQVCGN